MTGTVHKTAKSGTQNKRTTCERLDILQITY